MVTGPPMLRYTDQNKTNSQVKEGEKNYGWKR